MKATTKMTALKRALALVAVLALTGTAWAKPSSAPGVPGDLSGDRTSATVTITAQCDISVLGYSETVSVYILQSVGRLINIGIGDATVVCGPSVTATSQDTDITVNAIPGLTFQPGPATMLIRFTAPNPDPTKPDVVSEKGLIVNFHP